jgi:hypothetical protein
LVESLKLISELVVIDPKAVKNCGVEISNVNRILDNVVTVIIGLTIGNSGTHAPARHPGGEAARVMIAPVIFRC